MKSDKQDIEQSCRQAVEAAIEGYLAEMAEIGVDGENAAPFAFAILIEHAGRLLGRETPNAAALVIRNQKDWLTRWADIGRRENA